MKNISSPKSQIRPGPIQDFNAILAPAGKNK